MAGIEFIKSEVDLVAKNSYCKNAISAAEPLLDPVRSRWKEYIAPGALGPRSAINASVDAVSKGLEPLFQPDELRDRVFEPWIKKVLGEFGAGESGPSVYSALGNLHTRLVQVADPSGGSPAASSDIEAAAVINSCAISAMAKFRFRATQMSDTFAFDDRQYFDGIQNMLRYYQIWQARGAHMIQEALMFRTQQAALSAWAANQAVRFFFFVSVRLFCP